MYPSKYSVSILLLSCFHIFSFAQSGISYGFSAGPNISDFYIYYGLANGDEIAIPAHGGPLPAVGWNASIYAQKVLGRAFSSRAGFMYDRKKARTYNSLDEYGWADFLGVFGTAIYRPFKKSPLKFELGIASEIIINRSESFNNEEDFVWDFPVIIGLEADILSNWALNVRVLEPLNYINTTRIDEDFYRYERSQVFQFSLHYLITKK